MLSPKLQSAYQPKENTRQRKEGELYMGQEDSIQDEKVRIPLLSDKENSIAGVEGGRRVDSSLYEFHESCTRQPTQPRIEVCQNILQTGDNWNNTPTK